MSWVITEENLAGQVDVIAVAGELEDAEDYVEYLENNIDAGVQYHINVVEDITADSIPAPLTDEEYEYERQCNEADRAWKERGTC